MTQSNVQKLAFAESFVFRAKLYWAMGLTDSSIEDMMRAMRLAPDHLEVRRFNGAMQIKASELYVSASHRMICREFSHAIALLTAAIRILPDDIKLLVTRAAAHRQAGACELAIEDLKKASLSYQHETLVDTDMEQGSRPIRFREPYL